MPGGQAHDAAGPQRRGQDHDPAHHHGPVARRAGRDPLRRPRRSPGCDTPDIARLGIAYVPESMGIFADLTVQENMLLAARSARRRPIDRKRLDWVFWLLPGAEAVLELYPAGKLSGGQKQMLAVARAIIEPRRLLLIDEPTKGLAPAIIDNMIAAFRELKAASATTAAGRAELRIRAPLGDARGGDGRRPRRAQRRHGGPGGRRARCSSACWAWRWGRTNEARLPADWLAASWRRCWPLPLLPLVGSLDHWLTLTVAGLAMGLMIFIMASGLTLVFGLMDVLNFGHGVFIAVGAFVAASVLGAHRGWARTRLAWRNLAAMVVAVLAAMAVERRRSGWAFERVIVRPVYGQHLKQILITMGGMIVAEELLKVDVGPAARSRSRCPRRCAARSLLGDVAIEKYRVAGGGGRAGGVRRAGADPRAAPASAC